MVKFFFLKFIPELIQIWLIISKEEEPSCRDFAAASEPISTENKLTLSNANNVNASYWILDLIVTKSGFFF